MPKDAIPAIPQIPASVDPALRPFLQHLRDASIVRFGQGKNKLDRSPTVRELMAAGVIDALDSGSSVQLGGTISTREDENLIDADGNINIPDIVPAAPTNVVATVSPMGVLLTYDSRSSYVSHAEIWRAGPFDLSGDPATFPAMSLQEVDGAMTLTWVSGSEAVPLPDFYLAGVTTGFTYSEVLEPSKNYQYWVRWINYYDRPGPFHDINGLRVASSVDPAWMLSILEDQISEAQLTSALNTRINDAEDVAGSFATQLAAETAARVQGDLDEATARADDILDTEQLLEVEYLANRTANEARGLIQDVHIAELDTKFTDADSALASQITAIAAASAGEWNVVPDEPMIDPYWDGTKHWIDTDNNNTHFVSTDASRADTQEMWVTGSVSEGTGWTDNLDDTWTHAGGDGDLSITNVITVAGTYTIYFEVSGRTQGQLDIKKEGVVVGNTIANADGVYAFDVTGAANDDIALAATGSFDGTVSKISLRPKAVELWSDASAVEGAGWTDNADGSFTHAGAVDTDLSIANLIPTTAVYKLSYTMASRTQGELGLWLEGVEVSGKRRNSNGLHEVEFTGTAGDDLALRGLSSFDGTILDISVKLRDARQGWVDVTDARVESALALITTETAARISADNVQAQQITEINTLLTDADTGLQASADAIDALDIFIRDEGAGGMLSSLVRYTDLEAVVNHPVTGVNATATSLTGLSTYVDDQGPSGLLASSSLFTDLQTQVQVLDDGSTSTSNALQILDSYVRDQGPGGLLANSTLFTDLETQVSGYGAQILANQTAISDEASARATAIFNLDADLSQNIVDAEARVNANITTETTARVSADSALASDITTLTATAGSNTVAIQQNASVIADVQSDITGHYYVKLDNNGRITGLEFYDETTGNLTQESTFAIRADTFYVQNTSDDSIPLSMGAGVLNMDFDVINLSGVIPSANIGQLTADQINITGIPGASTVQDIQGYIAHYEKFVVGDLIASANYDGFTQGWGINVNGGAVFHNVFARGDIEASSIKAGSADIVDTLMLQNNAVTVPAFFSSSTLTGNGTFQLAHTAALTLSEPGRLFISVSINQGYGSGARDWGLKVTHGPSNTVMIDRSGMAAVNDMPTWTGSIMGSAGSNWFNVQWKGENSGITGQVNTFVIGAQR